MAFKLQSSNYGNNEKIPSKHSKDHENISPALTWTKPPENTQEFALLMEDPDVPGPTPFVHWLLYGIDPKITALPQGLHVTARQDGPSGLVGKNSFGELGYGGPLPPVGFPPHHYKFRLFALDKKLHLQAGLTREEFLKAIEGHVLEEANLTGTYQRGGEDRTKISGGTR